LAGYEATAFGRISDLHTLYARLVANIVVVSTHLDDAVFSCWHVIADARHEVSVVTVFTAAPEGQSGSWDRCIDPHVDSEVRALERQEEDRAALLVAGRTPVHLPFCDSQFGPTEQSAIARALKPYVEGADVVYAPLAIWHHDHVLVRSAVREDKLRPCFYLDYPYALKYPHEPQQKPSGLLDEYDTSEVPLGDDEVEAKLKACREYAGELARLHKCASFGDFATAENLRRETVYRPEA